MKFLRLTLAILLTASVVNVYAADSKKSSKKSSPTPSPTPGDSAKNDKSLPDVVAEVEGAKITKAELLKEFAGALKAIGKAEDTLSPDQKMQGYRAVLDDMIIDRLLRSRSKDVKIDDAEVAKNLDQLKAQFPSEKELNDALKKTGQTLDGVKEKIKISLQQQKWIESQIADKVAVKDEDAKAFYDKNPDKFQQPEMVRASHILIAVPDDATPEVAAAKEKLAKTTKERITKGEDFAALAKELSDDPGSKVNGGDLDFFPHDAMVPEFADAAFKLKVNDVSDPVKTKFGWHIIKVTDKKAARTIPFDEVKDKIVDYLKEGKRRDAVNDLLVDLKEKSGAKVFLPPPAKAAVEQAPVDTTAPAPAPDAGAGAPPAPEPGK